MSARLEVDDSYLRGVLSPQLADLALLGPDERRAWLLSLPPEVRRNRLPFLWEFWARPEQIWRPGPELITLVQAGRGWGKTRYGAQATRWVAEHPEECGFGRPPLNESAPIIGLVARTAHDVLATMIYGSSGLMSVSPPWFRPRFKPSEKLLIWPNGMRAYYFTAVLPESLRGPNLGFVWADEIAFYKSFGGERVDALDNIEQALRKACARGVYTTTPKPTAALFKLHERSQPRTVQVAVPASHHRPVSEPEPDVESAAEDDDDREVIDALRSVSDPEEDEQPAGPPAPPPRIIPADVRIVRGSSLDNAANQKDHWIRGQWAKRGTRFGRQEVDGELLSGNPRTLFPYELLNGRRVDPFEIGPRFRGESWPDFLRRVLELDRVCVAADPNGTDPGGDPDPDAAEFGIAVAGVGRNGREYSLADLSAHHSPFEWPGILYDTALIWRADAIVSETNYGGPMVRAAVETYVRGLMDKGQDAIPIQFVEVSAGKGGKVSRLKVFAQAVEQGLVYSVGDPALWSPLEAQLHAFNPTEHPDKQEVRVEISAADGSKRSVTLRFDRMDARVWAHLWLSGSEIVGGQTSFWLGGRGGKDAVALLRSLT